VVAQDISYLFNENLRLAKVEAIFKSLADSLHEILWVMSPSFDLTYVSPAFEKLWQLPHSRIMNEPECWLERMHPEDKDRIYAKYREMPEKGLDESFRIVLPSGEVRYCETKALPVHNDQGELLCVAGINRDVTEEQLLSQQLDKQRSLVEKYTGLSVAGEMTAVIAHELGQPIAAISNYARGCVWSLRSKPENLTDIIGALEEITSCSAQASNIIQSIREFFLAKDTLVKTSLNIVTLMKESLQLFKQQFELHNIKVELYSLQQDIEIAVYAEQLQRVIFNILKNAVESIDDLNQPGNSITINLELPKNHNQLRLTITDSGRGVNVDNSAKLFEPFVSTKKYGTGLGLAICKSIINAHAGNIQFIPQPQGACIEILLPR